MENKLKIMAMSLITLGMNSQAQKMQIWENGSMTEYTTSNVDSVVFKGLSSSDGSSSSQSVNSMIDSRDGKTYKTVMIGTQTWMAESLNYGAYLTDENSSSQYQDGAQKFCYGNQTSNCDAEGGLYQWHTAMGFDKTCGEGSKTCASQISSGNHQGICPVGWHLPKQAEWDALATQLDGTSVAGYKMKYLSFGGDNSSGFSALGAGDRRINGDFEYQGSYVFFWEAGELNAGSGYYRNLSSGSDILYRIYDYKRHGFSVRCLKD